METSLSCVLSRYSSSFNHLKLFQCVFVNCESQAGKIIIEVNETILGFGLALETVPEQFVANLDIDRREEFGHGRIQAGHDYVVVVHLAGVGNDGDGMRLGEGPDFAGLSQTAYAVGVELDV